MIHFLQHFGLLLTGMIFDPQENIITISYFLYIDYTLVDRYSHGIHQYERERGAQVLSTSRHLLWCFQCLDYAQKDTGTVVNFCSIESALHFVSSDWSIGFDRLFNNLLIFLRAKTEFLREKKNPYLSCRCKYSCNSEGNPAYSKV